MRELPFMNLSPVCIEIGQGWLKVLRENDGIDVQLERAANGNLTTACKENLVISLQRFLRRRNWQPRVRAWCAIGASGVSLRRMTLPFARGEELSKLVRLQIETEFPLSPDELAWGYQVLKHQTAEANPEVRPAESAAPRQEILVSAVKKERIEEYAGVLFAAGLNPVFTPAALARSYLCPQPVGSCAMADVGRGQLELVVFENGVPTALRVLPWGTGSNAETLVKAIGSQLAGYKIYVTGGNGSAADFVSGFRSRGGDGFQWERLEIAHGAGHSAAVLGLRKALGENAGLPPLLFQVAKPSSRSTFGFSQPVPKKWAIGAAALLCALLVLPFGEALLLKGHLSKKVAAIKSGQGTLSAIDHEFDFLRFLKQSQPPYLDALYLFAKAAPQGARIESTSMNRRGEVSLRGSMRDGQQVTDFRAKLIDSGFFERVSVEEQVPTPDRQKVNVRITAQWKPVDKRAGLSLGPTADEIAKAKTNSTANLPMRGGLPPGFPPGLMMQ